MTAHPTVEVEPATTPKQEPPSTMRTRTPEGWPTNGCAPQEALGNRAWTVFSDEAGALLLPPVRRTYVPRGCTPALQHWLN